MRVLFEHVTALTMDPALPERLLGKLGSQLWHYANGVDPSPVRPQHEKEAVKRCTAP